MKKKVLGFSLIEILIVIGIIAILALFIIPNVGKYVKKGEVTYNTKLEDELTLVGTDYYARNKSKLPRGTSYSTYVSLSELESLGIVSKEFVDSKSGECRDDSYVRVIRDFETDEYTYHPCLVCENYKSEDSYCSISDLTHDYDFKCSIDTEPVSGWSKQYKINIDASNNITLKRALYNISSYNEIINSKTYTKSLVINKNNKQLIKDNNFEVYIEDVSGNIEKCSKPVQLDVIPPDCPLADAGNNKAKVTCTDTGGSGCLKDNPAYVPIKNGVANVTVYDNAGNSKTCSKKFDKEPPKCTVAKSPASEWSNTDVVVTGTCKDEGPGATGCKQASVSTKVTKEGITKISPGEVCDNAENCAPCPQVEVKIDKTKPQCKNTKNPPKVWSNTNVVITGKCYDNDGSGCVKASVEKTIEKAGKGKYSPGKVCDIAGNCKTCDEVFVNIDKTYPTCTVTKSPDTEWSTKNVTLTGKCADKGGSGCASEKVTKTYKEEGTGKYSPGQVCDNAGNCTSCGKKSVKIDKTAPTCEGAERNGNASNGNIRFKYTFKDNLSGVKAEKHGHCYAKESHIVNAHRCSYSSPTSRLNDAGYKSFENPKKTVTRNYNYNYGQGTVMIYFKLKDVAGNEGYCKLHQPPKASYTYSYKHTWD